MLSHDESPKPVVCEFECSTRYDRLFAGVVIPKAMWAMATSGAEHLRPEYVTIAPKTPRWISARFGGGYSSGTTE